MSGTGITMLDCYDSQDHDDYAVFSGSTNEDITHYRGLQSASGCSTPWAGKEGTGANFKSSSSSILFSLTEDYFRVIDLYFENSISGGGTYYGVYSYDNWRTKTINCVGVCTNGRAFYCHYSAGHLSYNCIARDSDYGFYAGNYTKGFICCTAINNTSYGFYVGYSSNSTSYCWSNYAADNGSDFRDASSYWDSPSGWNSSKDNTSDLGGLAGNNYKNGNDLITGGELDSDYLPTESISWSGGAGDNAGRNPYNDLTSVNDFDDFFKNDTGGEEISKSDIRGYGRLTPDTADVSWDIGAGQYQSEDLTPNECAIELVCDEPFLISIIPNECTIELICDEPELLDVVYPNECTINLVCDSPETGNLIIDWSIASTAEKTLNTSYTFFIAFVGARDGQRCCLILQQDTTGGRDIEFPSNVRGNNDVSLPPSLSSTPGAIDYIEFVYRENINVYDVISLVKGYGIVKPDESSIDLVCDSPDLLDILDADESSIDLVCDSPALS